MNLVLTAAITGASCAIVLFIGFIALLLIVRHKIRGFCTAPDDKTPSGLAGMFDSVSNLFACHIVGHLKTSMMGMQSVDSKLEKNLAGDIIMDTIGQRSPLLGILASFPAVAKRLRRNPGILPMVTALLEKMGKDNNKKPDGAVQMPLEFGGK